MKAARLANTAKVLVSVGLLALVFTRIDLGEARLALTRVRAGTLGAALALALAGYTGRALRWAALLRRAGVPMTLGRSYRLTLAGTFYGVVTPGRVGEFARVLHLGEPRTRTLPSVLWDRLGDVLLLEILSVPAFAALDAWHGPLLAAYLAVALATAGLVIALDSPRAPRLLGRLLPSALAWLERWSAGSSGVLTSRAFGLGMLGGLFFYALNFLGAFLLLRDLTPASSAGLALVFPVIILLGNLPIAFGGLGLREQVAAVAFGRFGAPAAIGPVFSLIWFAIITLVPGLLGLLLAWWPSAGKGASLAGPLPSSPPLARGDEREARP
jgi:hypothetical protein